MYLLDEESGAEDVGCDVRGDEADVSAVDPRPAIEAILFAADEPLSARRIASILGDGSISPGSVRGIIEELRLEYETGGKGFGIDEIADGYQILSRPEYHTFASKLLKRKRDFKISNASLETLAIIAYKQPVLRVDIEAVRGVQSGQMIRVLIDMGLVKVAGKADLPGRPLMYSTTNKFLQQFALKSIKDLPPVGDLKSP